MTTLDLVILVLGLATALALPQRATAGMFWVSLAAWAYLALSAEHFILMGAFALAAVIVARRFRYNTPAHPAEWLVLVLAARFLVEGLPNLDEAVNWTMAWRPPRPSTDFGLRRCELAGASLLAGGGVLLGLWTVGVTRSHGLATLAGFGLAFVCFWGPAPAFALEFPWRLPGQVPFQPKRFFEAYDRVRLATAWLPYLLIYGAPTLGVLREVVRMAPEQWTWPRWTGVTLAVVFGALELIL